MVYVQDVKKPTSYNVFMAFVKREGNNKVDASGILSRECYETWLLSRKSPPKHPPRAFKDALKTIVMATNRCRPFPADVEADLLIHLRAERVWDCFVSEPKVSIGCRGWKIVGFHEKRSRVDEKEEKCCEKFSQSGDTTDDSASHIEGGLEIEFPQHLAFTTIDKPAENEAFLDEFADLLTDTNPGSVLPKFEWNMKRKTRGLEDQVENGLTSSKGKHDTGVQQECNHVAENDLVAAYGVFEMLCQYPEKGYEFRYPILQSLLTNDVAKRFNELYTQGDIRLDLDFLCPDEGLLEDRPTMQCTALYKLDGMPFICTWADDAFRSYSGWAEYDPLNKPLMASECPLYDSWFVYAFKKKGLDMKLLGMEKCVIQTLSNRSPEEVRVVRSEMQVVSEAAGGGVNIKIMMQDVTDLYPTVPKLGMLFPDEIVPPSVKKLADEISAMHLSSAPASTSPVESVNNSGDTFAKYT